MAGTCRDAVLDAMRRLERRHGHAVFKLEDIVQEVEAHAPRYPNTTVRTQITSIMCANAPVHHLNHTNDLERMGRGMYRVAIPTAPIPEHAETLVPVSDAEVLTEPLPADWYWEGSVQAALALALEADGWKIEAVANTATREQGVDILAVRAQTTLVVEVKGYPSTTYARGPKVGQAKITTPNTQARVWYASAILSAMLLRDRYRRAAVAIGLPDMKTYRSLIARTKPSLIALGFGVLVIDADGVLDVVLPPLPRL